MASHIFKLKLLSSHTCLTASLPVHPSNLFLHHRATCSSPFSERFPGAPSLRRRSSHPSLLLRSDSSTQGLPFPYKPPSSREEAISQAKLCLSSTLRKSLNNSLPLPTRKLKKLRHPRFRVEIPVVDDSPASLTQLALDVFSDLPLQKKKKGDSARARLLIVWPSSAAVESATRAFASDDSVVNSDCSSVTPESLTSADLVVFSSPELSQLDELKSLTDALYPKPVVLFNPRWGFEEEKDLDRDGESFVSSFDVVYAFVGLEVRGVLSRKRGAVFKCTRDGVASGEGWVVMVEEEGTGNKEEMKKVTSFKRRPSISEVENVLYNLMAANSPVTKSVKFISDLVSNVTGRKEKK